MRIVIAEDMALLRAGLVRLLADRGFEVVGEAADAVTLLRLVERVRPDAAIVDIKMPPTHTDEGLQAAAEIRERYPDTSVLLLSSYLDARYAAGLFDYLSASAAAALTTLRSSTDSSIVRASRGRWISSHRANGRSSR